MVHQHEGGSRIDPSISIYISIYIIMIYIPHIYDTSYHPREGVGAYGPSA